MVKAGGSGQSLWPRGCETIEDLPGDLSIAIDQAFRIISWLENYTEEELPPSWMWPLDHEITPWFEQVAANRRRKYGDAHDDREIVDMDVNEDAVGWRP